MDILEHFDLLILFTFLLEEPLFKGYKLLVLFKFIKVFLLLDLWWVYYLLVLGGQLIVVSKWIIQLLLIIICKIITATSFVNFDFILTD